MKIYLCKDEVCGSVRHKPRCKFSKLIADILGKQCLAPSVIAKLLNMGMEIEYIPKFNSKKLTTIQKQEFTKLFYEQSIVPESMEIKAKFPWGCPWKSELSVEGRTIAEMVQNYLVEYDVEMKSMVEEEKALKRRIEEDERAEQLALELAELEAKRQEELEAIEESQSVVVTSEVVEVKIE